MLQIKEIMKQFEPLVVQLRENPSREQEELLLAALEEKFSGINSEVVELKRRLVTPEIPYNELLEKLQKRCKGEPELDGADLLFHAGYEFRHGSAGEEEYEYVKSRLTAVVTEELDALSEDTLWYYSSCEISGAEEGVSCRETVLADLVKLLFVRGERYLRERENERGGTPDMAELQQRVLTFSHETKIDTKTVHEWLKEKLHGGSEPDRMTAGILYNMVESVIEEISDDAVKTIAGTDSDPRDFLITELRQFLINACSK